MRDRTILFVAALVALTLISRLAHLQLFLSPALSAMAVAQRLRPVTLDAPRGTILDRRGTVLAASQPAVSLYAMPREITDVDAVVAALAPALGEDPAQLRERLSPESHFVWLVRRADPSLAAVVQSLGEPGVAALAETRRYYPQGDLAQSILGFVGDDDQGLGGIEFEWEDELAGINGRDLTEKNGIDELIPAGYRREDRPLAGSTLVLTIDTRVQQFAERRVAEWAELHQAKRAGVIVMETSTGRILAMAGYSNQPEDQHSGVLKNLLTGFVYEPGSTWKPLVVAATLDAGAISTTQLFDGPAYIEVDGGPPIWAWNRVGFGNQTARDALVNSDNVALTQIVMALGRDRYYQYMERYHLGKPVGSGAGGEDSGWFVPKEELLSDHQFAGMSFGQNLTTTPLQLLQGWNAIVNQGQVVRPHIVQEIQRVTGEVVALEPEILGQAIQPEVADLVRSYLVDVAKTTLPYRSSSYPVGGKTGTAQKAENGVYLTGDKYIVSFAGFAPAENPVLTGIVFLDEPSRGDAPVYGSTMAAPLLQDIFDYALPLLGVLPDDSQCRLLPDYRNLPVSIAQSDAEALGWRVERTGQGDVVVDQKVTGSDALRLILGTGSDAVPYLIGLPVRQLPESWLARFAIQGTGPLIVGQDLQPGSPWQRTVTLTLGAEDPRPALFAGGAQAGLGDDRPDQP